MTPDQIQIQIQTPDSIQVYFNNLIDRRTYSVEVDQNLILLGNVKRPRVCEERVWV